MKLFLEGILIGVGKVLPGISGSLIAVSLGIYEKLITIFNTNITKTNIKYIFVLFSGVIVAIIFTSKLLLHFVTNYYVYTISLFIGVILSGIFQTYKKNNNKITYIPFLLCFFIPILLNFFTTTQLKTIDSIYVSFFLGIIESLTTLIPGISGTVVLSILGYYEAVLTNWSLLFDINLLSSNLAFLLPYIAGFIAASIFIIKIVNYLLKKHKIKLYSSVLGFSLSSIVVMLFNIFKTKPAIFECIIVIILNIIGYKIGRLLDKIS